VTQQQEQDLIVAIKSIAESLQQLTMLAQSVVHQKLDLSPGLPPKPPQYRS
jgi:hypothetical protein